MPEGDPSQQRAYQRGLEAAQLKTTLNAHEQRLLAINGSIARSGVELAKIHECLDELVADQKTRAAIESALDKAVTTAAAKVKDAAENQVTKLHLYGVGLGLAIAIVVPLFLGAR